MYGICYKSAVVSHVCLMMICGKVACVRQAKPMRCYTFYPLLFPCNYSEKNLTTFYQILINIVNEKDCACVSVQISISQASL